MTFYEWLLTVEDESGIVRLAAWLREKKGLSNYESVYSYLRHINAKRETLELLNQALFRYLREGVHK